MGKLRFTTRWWPIRIRIPSPINKLKRQCRLLLAIINNSLARSKWYRHIYMVLEDCFKGCFQDVEWKMNATA